MNVEQRRTGQVREADPALVISNAEAERISGVVQRYLEGELGDGVQYALLLDQGKGEQFAHVQATRGTARRLAEFLDASIVKMGKEAGGLADFLNSLTSPKPRISDLERAALSKELDQIEARVRELVEKLDAK